jgi:hypothetical protein
MTEATSNPEFERGRQAGLQQAIHYHDQGETQAYRDLSDAERRFDREDGEQANRRLRWHSEAIETLRWVIENPAFFGKAPR